MLTNKKEDKGEDLKNKLDSFLKDNNTCEGDECKINDPQEIVQREHKKIITNDGRQLLSEYTV